MRRGKVRGAAERADGRGATVFDEEAEDSDYNLRKLQRRHKGLQQTFRMLEQMGEDTTSVKVQRRPSFHIHSQGSDIQSQSWYVLL